MIITKIKEKKGISLIHVLVGIVIIGLLAIPIARWVMSMTQNVAVNEERMRLQSEKMEMQAIMQNYWQKIAEMSYDDFQTEIATKGSKWIEDLGGKYKLTVEWSANGKYANSLCNDGVAPGANDRPCRKATLTLISKDNPSLVESSYMSRISNASLDGKLLKLAKDINNENDKFKEYYTKTEADGQYACPWDYHLVSGKCVACPAPSNWKQYRSGDCTLGTCPTGQKANAAKNGCEAITCSGRTKLVGDTCTACPLSGTKQYYTSSTGCSIGTCPTGKKVNAAGTGCEAITCPSGKHLSGDTCVSDDPCYDPSATCYTNELRTTERCWCDEYQQVCRSGGTTKTCGYSCDDWRCDPMG